MGLTVKGDPGGPHDSLERNARRHDRTLDHNAAMHERTGGPPLTLRGCSLGRHFTHAPNMRARRWIRNLTGLRMSAGL